jgi:hypothetical protein
VRCRSGTRLRYRCSGLPAKSVIGTRVSRANDYLISLECLMHDGPRDYRRDDDDDRDWSGDMT